LFRAAARAGEAGAGTATLADLDTGDPAVAAVIDRVRRVQGHGISILIHGETGTGKELLARAIHQESERRRGPFVAVDCASLPESLIEAELFGYEEGAFTGARRHGNPGKILHADGGTLFLDEIGDMPLALQARLLRVLQERAVLPLGGAPRASGGHRRHLRHPPGPARDDAGGNVP
jgi:transcriptional regulator with PAS, ATPase and Fis domain